MNYNKKPFKSIQTESSSEKAGRSVACLKILAQLFPNYTWERACREVSERIQEDKLIRNPHHNKILRYKGTEAQEERKRELMEESERNMKLREQN